MASSLETIEFGNQLQSELVSSKPATHASEIIRTGDSITVKILNLEDSERVVREAFEGSGFGNLKWSVVIEDSDPDEDEDDDDEDIDIQLVEDFVGGIGMSGSANDGLDNDGDDIADSKDHPEEEDHDSESDTESHKRVKAKLERETELNAFCAPIIKLLDTILEAGGSLSTFSWTFRGGWWGSAGQRYKPFWTALWKHCSKLENLRLGFYTHELHHVPGPTPDQTFPVLKNLIIDADTAHGDDGSAVEGLLKLSPALKSLDFSWPGCDLDNCQIKNITWSYNFPQLTSLTLYGSDFAPEALASFLEHHPSIQNFVDGVDGDARMLFSEFPGPRLSSTALSNVKAVNRAGDSTRYPEDWFADSAERKIKHLGLPWGWKGGFEVTATAAKELKCLEINAGNVTAWRPKEVDSDESDEEEKKKIEEDPEKDIVKGVRAILPKLTGLQELGIRLESNSVTMQLANGEWGSPPGMDENDLRVVLSVLPKETNIRALRIWDTKGKSLPQQILDDFPDIPKSLEYLAWDGEEKVLYQFMRRGSGKVKAVVCDEPVRVVEEERKKLWNEKRILDY